MIISEEHSKQAKEKKMPIYFSFPCEIRYPAWIKDDNVS